LCLFAPVSQNEFFQGVIGCLNWIMPMSWPIVAIGLLFYLVFHLIGALDENVLRRGNAYSERLAESNSTGMSGNNIPMWA